MPKDETILFRFVEKGIRTSFSKLMKSALFVIIGVTLILFIIYYAIIGLNDVHFMPNHDMRFRRRPLLLNMEPELNSSDFQKLFNITDFKFTIQQSSCSDLGLSLDLLVLVHTAPHHYQQRQMIRHTWGSQKQNAKFGKFRVLFLLGSVEDPTTQSTIVLENLQFKDIIQGSFIDHYRNLTYKHVMGLKWLKYYCAEAKVVLKVDDDVFVNTPFILQAFETNLWKVMQDQNKDFIICNPMIGSEIIRNNDSKYYVSEEALQGDVFPPYCSGYAVFYAGQTAVKLYDEAQKLRYLNIDDAFVTGVVRRKTGIKMTEYKYLEKPDIEWLFKDLRDFQDDAMRNFFIGPFEIDPTIMEQLWDALLMFMKNSDTVV